MKRKTYGGEHSIIHHSSSQEFAVSEVEKGKRLKTRAKCLAVHNAGDKIGGKIED